MLLNLRIAFIVVVLVFIFIILREIRRKKINITFSLFWLIIGGLLILAVAVPNLIETLSKLIGFETPSNMLFVIAIFIAFYSIFNLTLIASKEYKKNIILIQEVSLLKEKVIKLEEKLNGK